MSLPKPIALALAQFQLCLVCLEKSWFRGSGNLPARHSGCMASPPQNHSKINIFGPRTSKNQYFSFQELPKPLKNQYFLSPGHQKPIFSVAGAPKTNIFCRRTTKNQYFLSPEYQKPIVSVAGTPKINIFCRQSTKNEYCLSPEHQKSIFSVAGA